MTGRRARSASLALALLAPMLLVAPATAQAVIGRVLDDQSRSGIEAVALYLIDGAGRQRAAVASDSGGAFTVPVPQPGLYTVRAEHIGYQTITTHDLRVNAGEMVIVELRMGVRAIPLEPLYVVQRTRYRIGKLEEFYSRMERMRAVGLGNFISRDEIEARGAMRLSDMIDRIPGVYTVRLDYTGRRGVAMRQHGTLCAPVLYMDGMPIRSITGALPIDDLVSTSDTEGVEVYQGLSQMPGDMHDRAGCGVVAVWTRRGLPEGEGRSNSLPRLAIVIGSLIAIWTIQVLR